MGKWVKEPLERESVLNLCFVMKRGGKTVVLVGARFDFERCCSAMLQRASSGRKGGKKEIKKEEDHSANCKEKGAFSFYHISKTFNCL